MAKLRAHPAAELFEMLPQDELADLAADIKANGLNHPIVVVDGCGEWLILDGRNRYEACRIAGVTPSQRVWSGDDPIAFVLSENLRRRHMSASKRAMLGLAVEDMYAAEARRRQLNAGVRGAEGGRGKTKETLPAKLPEGFEDNDTPAKQGHVSAPPDRRLRADHESRTKAAKAVGVSPRTIQHAKKVAESAAPEVVAAVHRGDVTVSDAARVADAPKEVQAALVAKVQSGEVRTLRRAAAPEPRWDRERFISDVNDKLEEWCAEWVDHIGAADGFIRVLRMKAESLCGVNNNG